MNIAQQNTVSVIQDTALDLLTLRRRLTDLAQLYTTLNLSGLVDADFASIPTFANITAANFQVAAVAIQAILTTVGDYSSATTNASKLSKIINNIPK